MCCCTGTPKCTTVVGSTSMCVVALVHMRADTMCVIVHPFQLLYCSIHVHPCSMVYVHWCTSSSGCTAVLVYLRALLCPHIHVHHCTITHSSASALGHLEHCRTFTPMCAAVLVNLCAPFNWYILVFCSTGAPMC